MKNKFFTFKAHDDAKTRRLQSKVKEEADPAFPFYFGNGMVEWGLRLCNLKLYSLGNVTETFFFSVGKQSPSSLCSSQANSTETSSTLLHGKQMVL